MRVIQNSVMTKWPHITVVNTITAPTNDSTDSFIDKLLPVAYAKQPHYPM